MNMTSIIPDRLAILETITLGKGSHADFNKGVCALEAAAWLAGEPHSDQPACVCPTITTIVVSWNDSLPDDAHRNRLIRPLLPKIVGTRMPKGSKEANERHDRVVLKRAFIVMDWHVRVRTPAFLRLAGLVEHAEAIEQLPEVTDVASLTPTTEALRAAYSAARSAAESAAYSAARSAAESAAYSAARSAAYSAARSAAYSAAYSAAQATVDELHTSFAAVVVRMSEVTE